jgi:hypothetical protein
VALERRRLEIGRARTDQGTRGIRTASVAETSRLHPAREGAAWSSGIIGVVPRLKCGQAECVGEASGNAVKSVRNDRVGDGRGPRHRLKSEYYRYSSGSGASEATESFTKRLVTNEK